MIMLENRGAGHFLPGVWGCPGRMQCAPTKDNGCAEGRSPFAGGSGVSPVSFVSTPKNGGKGVEKGSQRASR